MTHSTDTIGRIDSAPPEAPIVAPRFRRRSEQPLYRRNQRSRP